MKFRSAAALLLAALSITILVGCAVQAAAPVPSQPVITITAAPTVPLTPVPEPVPPTQPSASAEAGRITREEAIVIALTDAGFAQEQVSRLRAEFDYDDGRPVYEVEFRQDRYEYDYEIHAETGAILRKDVDRDD